MIRTGLPEEGRARTVRLVFDHEKGHPSRSAAVSSIAALFGVDVATPRRALEGLGAESTQTKPVVAMRLVADNNRR
jgi:hypothetical protein